MGLAQYYGKEVYIISENGKSFVGTVNDYFDAEDNDFGKESIIIDTPKGDVVEFTEDDIQTIIIM